jgi:hypothetical protein
MHRAAATIEDDAYARAVVQLMSSYLHVMLIEPEQAAVLSAQAIATAAEHGFRQIGWWVRMPHGWAQAQLGHPDEGASLIRETLTTYRANGSVFLVPVFLTWLAEAQALGGAGRRLADARRSADPDPRERPSDGEQGWRLRSPALLT